MFPMKQKTAQPMLRAIAHGIETASRRLSTNTSAAETNGMTASTIVVWAANPANSTTTKLIAGNRVEATPAAALWPGDPDLSPGSPGGTIGMKSKKSMPATSFGRVPRRLESRGLACWCESHGYSSCFRSVIRTAERRLRMRGSAKLMSSPDHGHEPRNRPPNSLGGAQHLRHSVDTGRFARKRAATAGDPQNGTLRSL
jgi:hypothetical protein